MDNDSMILAAKVGGSSVLGSALAMKFLPGPWWQRILLFVISVGLGMIGGFAGLELSGVAPGGGMHLLMTSSMSIFGVSFAINVNSRLPDIADELPKIVGAIRDKILGGK